MTAVSWLEQAHLLDEQDPLAAFRQRFAPIDSDLIYLDGNSLGRLPLATADRLDRAVRHEWGERLIRSWNEGWLDLPQELGAALAPLLGAAPDEVIVADSTSVNLFKLALAAQVHQQGRRVIITDDLNFPSDIYILESAARLMPGTAVRVIPSADGIHAPLEQIIAAIDENTALVSLSHVAFKSGALLDMTAVNARARAVGALTLWDLSHSAGALPVDLNGSGADLAVGCTYKYLNGGPGAPAYLYVRRDLQDQLHNPISGWMGHAALFDFDPAYRPAPGLRRFLSGTPPVLSLRGIAAGVDLLREATLPAVRAKSLYLGEILVQQWRTELAPLGFYLNSPADAARRGSHIALGHAEGLAIDQALIAEMNVLPDFRAPDTIRFGLAPLYTTYTEVATAVQRLRAVVLEKRYERYANHRSAVT